MIIHYKVTGVIGQQNMHMNMRKNGNIYNMDISVKRIFPHLKVN